MKEGRKEGIKEGGTHVDIRSGLTKKDPTAPM